MKGSQNNIKICVACSTGGHLVEVRQLESVYKQYEYFYFTFNGGVADEIRKTSRLRSIPNIVRHNPLSWIIGAFLSFRIAIQEKPDIVITTGAGIVVFFCIFAKLFGAKLIFLESMARVEKPTLTARMLYPFANLFFVPWPGLLKYFPRGKIYGEIILIFLTVGTWRVGYDRLVKAVDELMGEGVITEEVIAQTGYSSYRPKRMKVMDFYSPGEFVEIISRARIVISHAGMGTIIEVVKQGKPLVVVPRRTELGEADNDHQFATARQLEEEGKILVAYEVSELPEKLKKAETFVPIQGQDSGEILNAVQKFIDDLITRKGNQARRREQIL